MAYERMVDGLLVSDDPARLDRELIFRFLSEESYWVPGIRREHVDTAIRHSLCFGAYRNGTQLAFARCVTDRAGFAYLADVFVVPAARGQGISKTLMGAILSHPDLAVIRRFILATRDAHGLYAQFGFAPLARPGNFMERYDPEALSRQP